MKHSQYILRIVAALCLLIWMPLNANAAERGYNNIVFFGDSLSDNGNLYHRTYGFIPKSPPYFEGQFSNGPTWAAHVAEHYLPENMTAENFAVGSATVVFRNPTKGYLPYTLTMSVYNHLIRSAMSDKSHTLYVIWMGANDYFQGASDVDGATTEVVNVIGENIEKLIAHDAKYVLLMNLPDLARTPFGKTGDHADNLTALIKAHNQKLTALVTDLQTKHPDVVIHLYDIYSDFEGLLNNPDVYNHKYHTHLLNLTQSCWGGGYTLHNSSASEHDVLVNKIKAHLQQAKRTNRFAATDAPISPDQLATTILATPSLRAAYDVSQRYDNGEQPCSNQDDYVFWDKVHPTAVVHNIFSQIMVEYIDRHYH